MKRIIAALALAFLSASAAGQTESASALVVKGTVLEAREAGTYTYLRLQTAAGETWAAVPGSAVSPGAEVTIADAALMTDFESKSLHRTFERIVFGVLAGAAATTPAAAVPSAPHAQFVNSAAIVKVDKADGPAGYSVAEVVGQRGDLDGQTVVVRGQVVKFSAGVMGRNWVHLRDGSGSAADKSDDLLVTTSDSATVGDIVTAQGTVAIDKDFGAGYSYRVLVENGRLR